MSSQEDKEDQMELVRNILYLINRQLRCVLATMHRQNKNTIGFRKRQNVKKLYSTKKEKGCIDKHKNDTRF